MTFPNQHRYPGGVPLWALAGHELTAGERVETVQFEQGEDRLREIRTFTPWMATVATKWLTQAQFDIFAAWFDAEVEGGARRFDCPIASMEGDGVQWWEAQFVGPYRYEARSARYRISAELVLLDGPYAGGTGPGTTGDTRVAPSLMGRAYSDSAATARMNSPTLRGDLLSDSEGWLMVDNSLHGRLESNGEGWAIVDVGYLLLADGTAVVLFSNGIDGILLET
jgi:hypothetical protein